MPGGYFDIGFSDQLAVIPVLVGPLQILLAILPALIVAVGSILAALFRPSFLKAFLKLAWRLKWQIVILVALVAGVGAAIRRLTPPPVVEAASAGVDWPMFRGGPARTGAVQGSPGPSGGAINWVWRPGAEAFYSSPAVVGDRVYVSSALVGVFKRSGGIHALDAKTGVPVWSGGPRDYRPTFSSPSVSGNRLVCGEGLHVVRDARIVCLDLSPGREGKLLWTFATKSHVESTPVIAGGRVYAGAGDDGIYCLDLEPSAGGEPVLRWHVPGDRFPDAETSLMVHRGVVYAGLGIGGRAICMLDADTGRELHRLDTPYPVFGPPSIAGDMLLAGMGNGDMINGADFLLAQELARLRAAKAGPAELDAAKRLWARGGAVWCIDTRTFDVAWKYETPDAVLGAVVVAGDELYFSDRSGRVVCLDREGRLLRSRELGETVIASVAVAERLVYVVTAAGRLYGLDRKTLEPVWELTVGRGNMCLSSPAVSGDKLYVGTGEDGVVCAGAAGGVDEPELWAGRLGGAGRSGNADESRLPLSAGFLWNHPANATGTPVAATAPAVNGGRVVVGLSGAGNNGVVCFNPAGAGAEGVAEWEFAASNGVVAAPLMTTGAVFFVDGAGGEANRSLYCIELSTGAEVWRRPVAPLASGRMALQSDAVLVELDAGTVSSLGLDGSQRWSAETGRLAFEPCPLPSMALLVVEQPGVVNALVCLDDSTGGVLWTRSDGVPLRSAPAPCGASFCVLTEAGLEERDMVDGRMLRLLAPDAPSGGELVARGDMLAYISATGAVVVVSRTDGSVARHAGATPGLAPLLTRDGIVFQGPAAVMRVAMSGADATPAELVDTSWLDGPATPLVLFGGRLYAGFRGWGLVCLGGER